MFMRWLCRVLAGLVVGFPAAGAFAVTVIVPTDQPTVQAAVTAAGAGGTVIINSNATFSETVTVTQSLTIHGGVGFTPTIQGGGTCGVVSGCTLFFEPNSASGETLAVSGVRLLPGSGPEVVRILNLGSGDANVILDSCTIEGPEGVGFLAVDIRRASCSTGLNHVTVQNGSINIAGASDGSSGRGGFVMAEGGSLTVFNVHLAMSGIAGQAFDITATPACGGIIFQLSDSNVSVTAPTAAYSAELASILLGVTSTIEHNSFQAISNGQGFAGGITVGAGTVQTYSASMTLDANRFVGLGPNVGDAVNAAPYTNGSVVMTATNNVVRNMREGFSVGQNFSPAGTVTATLANNTVDGSLVDAIALNSFSGSTTTVTAENNLLTHSGGWGLSFASEAGGSATITADYNGFFDNSTGNVEAPLADLPHNVLGDPIYVDRAGGDLRLGIGSPMIGAGNNSFALTTTDADGAMRIQDQTVEIGAFEGEFAVNTPTSTATPSVTGTPTPTSTSASTSTPPPATSTPTQTVMPTHTVPATPKATETPSRTATPSNTATLPPSATSTSTETLTSTPTPTRMSTNSPAMTPAASETSAPVLTATHTPTATTLSTFTATATPMATALASDTPTVTPRPCVGDCSGSGVVSISNLILGVNIALGQQPVSACPAFESEQGKVDIAQLIKGVNNALNGCGTGP